MHQPKKMTPYDIIHCMITSIYSILKDTRNGELSSQSKRFTLTFFWHVESYHWRYLQRMMDSCLHRWITQFDYGTFERLPLAWAAKHRLFDNSEFKTRAYYTYHTLESSHMTHLEWYLLSRSITTPRSCSMIPPISTRSLFRPSLWKTLHLPRFHSLHVHWLWLLWSSHRAASTSLSGPREVHTISWMPMTAQCSHDWQDTSL